MVFNINEYMGTWYDLLHYPSFFQKNDDYNTQARYVLLKDGSVDVVNTSMNNGFVVNAHGTATPLGKQQFHVKFDIPKQVVDTKTPNYIIQKIWRNARNEYAFAVVTNADKSAVWLLSRAKHPSLQDYEDVLAYMTSNFDSKKFIATPHYD